MSFIQTGKFMPLVLPSLAKVPYRPLPPGEARNAKTTSVSVYRKGVNSALAVRLAVEIENIFT